MKPTNEQLNEWCGTQGINYYEGDTALGLLFKYAVPKLGLLQIILQPDTSGWYCGLNIDGKQQVELYESNNKDPALALFWALYSLIDKKP